MTKSDLLALLAPYPDDTELALAEWGADHLPPIPLGAVYPLPPIEWWRGLPLARRLHRGCLVLDQCREGDA